jgi:hypothetical protein
MVSGYESLVRALDTIFGENSVGQASFVFDSLLVSLVRVYYYSVDLQPLIRFIDKFRYPQSALATFDPIGVDYISKRTSGTMHFDAIESICDDIHMDLEPSKTL